MPQSLLVLLIMIVIKTKGIALKELQRDLIENTKHAFYLLVLGIRRCSVTVD